MSIYSNLFASVSNQNDAVKSFTMDRSTTNTDLDIIKVENVNQKFRSVLTNERFGGVTWYVQKTLNVLFAFTPVGGTCDESMINSAIASVIDSYRFNYQETLFRLPGRQKDLLIAIAKEGNAKSITSGGFAKRYSLTSPSSVQAAVKGLLEKDFITLFDVYYSVYDKFFEMWLKQNY